MRGSRAPHKNRARPELGHVDKGGEHIEEDAVSSPSRQKVSSSFVYYSMNPVTVLHELVLPTEGKLYLFLDGKMKRKEQDSYGVKRTFLMVK